MKKRIGSLFLVLAMCLSLMPTAVLADEIQDTAQGNDIPVSKPEQEPVADKAVETVRSAIDALPAADDWDELAAVEQQTVAEDASAAYEAYEALTEDQQAALSAELEKLKALFDKINGEIAPLALAGSGTEADPYIVSSAEDWASVCDKNKYGNLNKVHIKLSNNIDLSETSFQSVTLVNGSLDGSGYTISGLAKPLFASLNGATINNLAVVGSKVTTTSYGSGILAEYAKDTNRIENCYINGTVQLSYSNNFYGVGGILGAVDENATTTLKNCVLDADIINMATSGSQCNTGGLVGIVKKCKLTIENCYTTGNVIASGKYAGGLIGYINSSSATVTINNSAALQSNVSGDSEFREGRIVGSSTNFNTKNVNVTDTYAYASMSGKNHTSGYKTGGINGTDVSKEDCTRSSFWTGLNLDTSIWTIEDGKLPRLTSLKAMTGNPPTYLLDAASCPVKIDKGTTISVSFKTTDKDTVTITAAVTVNNPDNVSLSAGDFTLSSADTASVAISGLSIIGLDDNTLTLSIAKSVNAEKAYLFYKSYCIGEITLSKNVSKVVLEAPADVKWDTSLSGRAVWNKVANATKYSIQLYKDNKIQGKAIITTDTSCDFASVIADTGSYTFTVMAVGDNTYDNSVETTSDAYVFTQQTLANVKNAAETVLNKMLVSNDTTSDEVLNVVTDRITNKKIKAAWSVSDPFTRNNATDGENIGKDGSITGTIVLTLDGTTENEIITVKLTIKPKFSVAFASGNDSAFGTAPVQENITSGTKITLPENSYTYYGRKFIGWSDGKSTYQPDIAYTMPAGNVTFTAQWTDDVWDGTAKSTSLNGSGTADDPYIIASGADLNYLADMGTAYCSKYYKLMADIDMGDHEMLPIYHLTGTFDGNGHKIINMKIAGSGVYYGMFKEAGNSGTAAVIKDLTLEKASINDTKASDSGKLGLLVSYTSDKLMIDNCYVTGSITTTGKPYMNIGGMVGQAKGADVTISRCYAGVTFTGGNSNSTFGGLVGSCEGVIIENCYATPDMSGVTSGYRSGITSGSNSKPANITNCYAAGESLNGAGIARNTAAVSNSVSIFPEMRDSARIFVNDNNVTGSNNYGFDGTIQRDSNGIITLPAEQFAADKAQGADATAAQVRSFSFYKDTLGWDEDIWEIRSGYDFPVLKGQKSVPVLALDLTPSVVSVTLDKSSATLPCGGTLKLTATVDVKNGGSQTVQWHSSDTSMAVVDGNGQVTIPANAASGSVKITATATADASKIAVCTINADADSYTLSSKRDTSASNSPDAVCTFYKTSEDAQNQENALNANDMIQAGTTVFARITNMSDEDVANKVLVNGVEATRLNGSTFSFTMPCANASVVFSCAVNLNAYNYVWFVGKDWGTWGDTVTYNTVKWDNADHIGSLAITNIINGKQFDGFELKFVTGYDKITKAETSVTLTQKNSKDELRDPGDYFVDKSGAHPVLYVYNDKPGTIMANIKLKDDPNASYNITKEPASDDYYTLDKTSAKAGDTVTATLTKNGIDAIGNNQNMTLDYYGGLLVVMFPGQFQKDENGTWTASFKMPAQDITTRAYVSSKLEVTLTGNDKTVDYNGQPQTIDSAITAELGGVDASEAMWGHYEVTYTNGSITSKTAPADAGTYTCTVRILDSDPLYFGTLKGNVKLTIKKSTLNKVPAAPEATSITKNSVTLNKTATFADGSAIPEGYIIEYKCGNGAWQDSPSFTGLKAAATYTFYARIKESKNTEASESSAGAEIKTSDKDTVTFKLPDADQNFTYDKTAKTPGMATVDVSGITLETLFTGATEDGTAYSSAAAPTNAGTYQVIYKVPDSDPGYQGTSKPVSFKINKRTITVKADDKSMTVGAALPEFTVSYGNLVSGDSAESVFEKPASASTAADGKTAGSFKITVTSPTLKTEAANNYKIAAPENGTLTVSRRSSGGGSSSTTYPVNTPAKTENGTVTISPKNASKGRTVTITVKPDSGYKLDDLTVKDKDGNELKLTDKGSGNYTFTMPAGKVDISAAFAKEVEVSPFNDISTSAYYYEAVKWAHEKGITGGIGDSLFGPDQPCTRAQIVTFLWRSAGSPEPENASSFSDVSTDSYYVKAVAWAVENGITTGTGNGRFSPDDACTRAQIVTFLFRALGRQTDTRTEFSDVPADSYYANAVAWAVENNITNGIGNGLFGPGSNCTRAQIVTFLYRAYQK